MKSKLKYKAEITQLKSEFFESDFENKISICQKGMVLSDSFNDVLNGFFFRFQIIYPSLQTGKLEKTLPAFAWMKIKFEKHPEIRKFNLEKMSWGYRYVVKNICSFPQIKNNQILEILNDMENFFISNEIEMKDFYKTASSVFSDLGNKKKHKKYYNLWKKSKLKSKSIKKTSNDHDILTEICYLINKGKTQDAIEKALDFLENPEKNKNSYVKNFISSNILNSLAKKNLTKKADEIQKKTYQEIKNKTEFFRLFDQHIEYLIERKKYKKALKIFSQEFDLAKKWNNLSEKFYFMSSGAYLFSKMYDSGIKTTKANFSKNFEKYNKNQEYNVLELRKHFREISKKLAEKFDNRSKNKRFSVYLNARCTQYAGLMHFLSEKIPFMKKIFDHKIFRFF